MKIGEGFGRVGKLIYCAAFAFSGLSGAATPRPILASEANYQTTLTVGNGDREKGATCYVNEMPVVASVPASKLAVTLVYASCFDDGKGGRAELGIQSRNPISGTFTVDHFSAMDNK